MIKDVLLKCCFVDYILDQHVLVVVLVIGVACFVTAMPNLGSMNFSARGHCEVLYIWTQYFAIYAIIAFLLMVRRSGYSLHSRYEI